MKKNRGINTAAVIATSICVLIIMNWFMLSVRIPSYGCSREVWPESTKEA